MRIERRRDGAPVGEHERATDRLDDAKKNNLPELRA